MRGLVVTMEVGGRCRGVPVVTFVSVALCGTLCLCGENYKAESRVTR
jgi:hypothetical protein